MAAGRSPAPADWRQDGRLLAEPVPARWPTGDSDLEVEDEPRDGLWAEVRRNAAAAAQPNSVDALLEEFGLNEPIAVADDPEWQQLLAECC